MRSRLVGRVCSRRLASHRSSSFCCLKLESALSAMQSMRFHQTLARESTQLCPTSCTSRVRLMRRLRAPKMLTNCCTALCLPTAWRAVPRPKRSPVSRKWASLTNTRSRERRIRLHGLRGLPTSSYEPSCCPKHSRVCSRPRPLCSCNAQISVTQPFGGRRKQQRSGSSHSCSHSLGRRYWRQRGHGSRSFSGDFCRLCSDTHAYRWRLLTGAPDIFAWKGGSTNTQAGRRDQRVRVFSVRIAILLC